MEFTLKEKISLYFDLTKPRIVTLVFITTMMGFFLAPGERTFWLLFMTLLGTGLASAGAAALNHCLERDTDLLMNRTKNRPIPSGKIQPVNAMIFGIVLVLLGVFVLNWQVNLMTSFLVLLTAFLYVLVYTPLKKITWLNTFIGSIPGALPPMVGWTAVTGQLQLGAYILFLILFAWQHPHFYALAWMYKEDYARGGLKMLPVVDPQGRRTVVHVILYTIILILVSILPTRFGLTGQVYFFGALILGLGFLVASAQFSITKSMPHAKRLFHASLIYFPLLFGLILIDAKFL